MADRKAQTANVLLSLYLKLYKKKYGRAPVINRYKEKWAMMDVIESVGEVRAEELLTYYFKTGKTGHPLQWFFYNFENLDKTMKELAEDYERRQRLMQETKRRVEEWKEQNELRIQTD